jgi:ABC-type branched-subunit amino acid transport system ATPase component
MNILFAQRIAIEQIGRQVERSILTWYYPRVPEERETSQSAVGKLPNSRERKVCSAARNFRRTTALVVIDEPHTG